jgi:hypothetical protein
MPLAEAFSPENRRSMLDLVQDKWIRGFLKNERYYDKDLLPLGLYRCSGNSSDLMLKNPLDPAMLLPDGRSITEVFDQAGGELLILILS